MDPTPDHDYTAGGATGKNHRDDPTDFDDAHRNQETYTLHNVSILDEEFGSGNVGVMGTCFNIFKCFVGIGILAMPNAFSDVRRKNFNILGWRYWRSTWCLDNRS